MITNTEAICEDIEDWINENYFIHDHKEAHKILVHLDRCKECKEKFEKSKEKEKEFISGRN